MTTTDCTDSGHPPFTVAEAVDHLCGYCLESHKDYLHARAGQREAEHRSQQLALELRHAEGYGYLDDAGLHALAVEAERGERLVTIRATITENTADRVAETIADCVRCRDLVEALFPRFVEVEL
ncbi:hypothetical protein [Tsukamurella strandjordii]|uniref:Uncharacterized protein n=1 Tax=Tsukamurella strandjordii TaxID=147577 RepID=A0AA90SRF5_9ACTN|nr:hypothetical protein [Tsukamurella strandjordii]MDP0398916.1 hypothetical protein [Tsukamurella strandjordii]